MSYERQLTQVYRTPKRADIMTTSVDAWNSVEGLPKQFVKSLRVLFDILDERNCGYVRLKDIESRWHEEGVQGLPAGVVGALRKVTPNNGYLSFDRFVSGLKLALLTNRKGNGDTSTAHGRKTSDSEQSETFWQNEKENQEYKSQPVRSRHLHTHRDAPGRGVQRSSHANIPQNNILHPNTTGIHRHPGINTAAVKPNNVHTGPLQDCSNRQDVLDKENYHKRNIKPVFNTLRHDRSKSPVKSATLGRDHGHVKRDPPLVSSSIPPQVPPRDKSRHIINELKSWQQRMKDVPQSGSSNVPEFQPSNSDSRLPRNSGSTGQDIYGIDFNQYSYG